ncbi:helix-turn-helix domain-containing protein [Calditrichota bacterium LG25]
MRLMVPLIFSFFFIAIPFRAALQIDWEKVNGLQHPEELHIYLEALEDSVDKAPARAYQYLYRLEPLVNRFNLPELTLDFLFSKGQYFFVTGQYQKALNIFLRCATLASEAQRQTDYLRAMNNIAVVYARMDHYRESNNQYRQLIPLAIQSADQRRLMIIYLNMANNFLFLNLPDSAALYYAKALPLTQQGSFYRAALEVNLARLHVQLKNYALAQELAWRSASYADSVGNVEMYLECLANIVNSYIGKKQWQKAERLAHQIEAIAQERQLRLQLKDAYLTLAQIYREMGEYARALDYFQKYDVLKDSLYNESISQQINELKIKYDTEKKEKELAFKEAIIKRKDRENQFLTLGALVMLILLSAIIILYIKKRMAYNLLVQKGLQWSDCGLTIRSKIAVNGAARQTISSEKEREIVRRIEEDFIGNKWFRESNLTIEKLSTRLGIHSRYLSQIIHEIYGMNFPQFLNNLRVQEAIRLFQEKDSQHYSIEGIGKQVGFQSKSTFHTAFKKITGVTPSYFRDGIKRMRKTSAEGSFLKKEKARPTKQSERSSC